jgi:hypothetical protein
MTTAAGVARPAGGGVAMAVMRFRELGILLALVLLVAATTISIEAHLTIVFAALAVSRHLQDATGVSVKKLVRTLRLLRTVQINVGGHTITAAPQITGDARNILDQLPPINAPGH